VWNYYAGYKTYKDTLQNLTEPVDRAVTAIEKYATPEQKKKLKLIVAEYGPFDWGNKWPHINDMGHTLANFEMTGDQLLRPEIEFSCFWNTRWIDNDSIESQAWDALDKNGNFNAIGYSLMIWGNFLGDKMIKTSSSLHTRSFASIKSSENKLFVYLLNKDEQSKNIQLNIQNKKVKSVVQVWELVGKNVDDLHPVWQKIETGNKSNNIQLKGTSITVIEYQLE